VVRCRPSGSIANDRSEPQPGADSGGTARSVRIRSLPPPRRPAGPGTLDSEASAIGRPATHRPPAITQVHPSQRLAGSRFRTVIQGQAHASLLPMSDEDRVFEASGHQRRKAEGVCELRHTRNIAAPGGGVPSREMVMSGGGTGLDYGRANVARPRLSMCAIPRTQRNLGASTSNHKLHGDVLADLSRGLT